MLHVACGVGWMGADVVLAILMLTGWFSDDGPTVAAAYTAARLVIPPAVPVLAGGMLVTGVLLGLGTKYGLVQWWWVFVKLVIGVVLTVLVFVLLLPGALDLPTGLTGTADEIRDQVGRRAGTCCSRRWSRSWRWRSRWSCRSSSPGGAPAGGARAGRASAAREGHDGLTTRIRSSSAAGSPRPSRLDVVTQRLPSGATSTVRSRP